IATDDYAHHAVDGSPIRRLGGEVWEATGGPLLIAGDFRNTWVQLRHEVADPSPPGADLDTKIVHRRRAVADWIAAFADRDELKRALEKADLAWADVRSPFEAIVAPTATARGVVADIDDRAGGRRGVVQSPYRFSDADSGVRGPAPYRGEHNAEVLREWLDLDDAAVADLAARGVLQAEGG
ncbi:MAG TPA: CoA transferase, partial [Acidimicrobiales bacterium]